MAGSRRRNSGAALADAGTCPMGAPDSLIRITADSRSSRPSGGLETAAAAQRLRDARNDRIVGGGERGRIADVERVLDLVAVRQKVARVEPLVAARPGEHQPVLAGGPIGDLVLRLAAFAQKGFEARNVVLERVE